MKIAIIVSALMLGGCGAWDRMKANYTGDASRVCVAGVTYLQFTSGVSVMYDISGKLVACR